MNRRNLALWLPLGLILVLCVAFVTSLEFEDRANLPSALLDKPLPAFELALLNGDIATNANTPQDQVYLLNVWATWCAPCRVEHPLLIEIAASGVPVIGLNYKDEDEKAIKWLRDQGDPFLLNLVDQSGDFGLDLGLSGVPVTFVIDAAGTVRYKHIGVLEESSWNEVLKPIIERLNSANV